ncbi:MAG: hypothetical protein AAF593_00330 [Planctomycetota bacterium]
MTLSPARPNHAIHQAPARAEAMVSEAQLTAVLGNPTSAGGSTSWAVRDTGTGAHLRVWGHENGVWRLAWLDGPRHPGSGRELTEGVCGAPAGGTIHES